MRRAIISGVVMVGLATAAFAPHAASAAGQRTLLATAIRNTDGARYYLESDSETTTVGTKSVTASIQNQYDEIHNRERDHYSSVTVTRSPNGSVTRSYYTLDLAMLNGRTYYRSSANRKGWQVKPGYGYTDPVSGSHWIRSSLRFGPLTRYPITSQGNSAQGQHIYSIALPVQAPERGTEHVRLFVTSGRHPYIAHFEDSGTLVVQGKTVTVTGHTDLLHFNVPASIVAPKLGS
jgi:hypothetical protein